MAFITRTFEKAKDEVGTIKRWLQSEKIVKDHGDFQDNDLWGTTKFRVLDCGIDKNPTLTAFGIGGQTEGSRLKRIFLDDLTDSRSFRPTPAERKLIETELKLTIIPRLDSGGTIFSIGSRWHPHDYHNLMKKMNMFKGHILEVKAIPDETIHKSIDESILSYEWLMEEKNDIGSIEFGLRYQGRASDLGLLMFPRIKTITEKQMQEIGIVARAMAVDPNSSEKESSDLTAVVFGTLLKNNWIVLDWVSSGHMLRGYGTFIDKAIRVSTTGVFGLPCRMYVESVNFQMMVADDIEQNISYNIPVIPIGRADETNLTKDDANWNRISKYDKIRLTLQGPVQAGTVRLFEDPDHPRRTGDIKVQFADYPDVENDDILDAAHILVRHFRGMNLNKKRRMPILRHR